MSHEPIILRDGDSHYDRELLRCDLAGQALRAAEFEDVVFRDGQFANAKMIGCHFTTCRFIDCDLSSVDLGGSTLNGVQFEQCRMLGVDFTAANPVLLDLGFRGSLLDYSDFQRLVLRRTKFIDCRMREVELANTKLEGAVFAGSDLQGAVFGRAVLTGTDLRGARNVSFDPRAVSLGRTRIDLETLLALGERLGLKTDTS